MGLIIEPCASYLAARDQEHQSLHCKITFNLNKLINMVVLPGTPQIGNPRIPLLQDKLDDMLV
jgi:hypothetical protein